jgi:hypothetical protein
MRLAKRDFPNSFAAAARLECDAHKKGAGARASAPLFISTCRGYSSRRVEPGGPPLPQELLPLLGVELHTVNLSLPSAWPEG